MAKKGSEIWTCPRCGAQVDITGLGLYAEVVCPQCRLVDRVHVQLGGFRLEKVLGIGGMSVVYRALDVSLQRPLALKVLNDDFRNDPERIERFEKESAMMARVRHENITAVYSAGRAYDQFYIAMELVEGENLEHRVTRNGPLEPLEAVSIVQQVARGLEAAQKAGLLHRDMKPGNILITRRGKAKVIDFGLALADKQGDTEEILWATPYYAAPETLNRQQEDARADIYAVGITLSFLLTGVGQFDEPVETVNQLLELKRNRPPFAEQMPEAPAVLSDLVDHMTAFSPNKRPSNYGELIEELDDVLGELRKQKLEASLGNSLWWRRLAHNAAAIAVSLLLGGILALFLSPAKIDLFREPEPVPLRNIDLQGEEMRALQAVVGRMERETAAAEQELLRISRESNEPALGAWSARLALFLCLRSSAPNPEGAEEAGRWLKRHLSNAGRALPAGRRVLEILSKEASVGEPGLADWFKHKGAWGSLTPQEVENEINRLNTLNCPAPLRFLLLDGLARRALWAIGPSAAGQIRRVMWQMVPNLQEYSSFRQCLVAAEEDDKLLHLSQMQGIVAEAQTGNCAPSEEAERKLRQIEKDDQAPPILRTMAEVKREAIFLSRHLCRTFVRKKPKNCQTGMTLPAMLKALGQDSSGIPPQIIQDARTIFGIAMTEYIRRARIGGYLQDEGKLSPEVVFILRDWEKRLGAAEDTDKRMRQAFDPGNTQQVEELLQACRDACSVTLLPGGPSLGYMDHPGGVYSGSSTIMPRIWAEFLARSGRARINRIDMLPVLGLKGERFATYSLTVGAVQPVPREIAEHFEQTGSGVILRSAEDLKKHARALSGEPRSFLLLRTPIFR